MNVDTLIKGQDNSEYHFYTIINEEKYFAINFDVLKVQKQIKD